jgi:uncharacterized membrane protein HdeD (DUF308 family)
VATRPPWTGQAGPLRHRGSVRDTIAGGSPASGEVARPFGTDPLINVHAGGAMSAAPTVVPEPDPVLHRLAGVGRSPVLLCVEGVLSALLGVLVLTWPGATVVVLAWLFGIHLLVTGVLQIVSASSDVAGTGDRVLSCMLGTLSILVGLLCLRTPLQTALVLGLLIGVTWVVGGSIRIVQGVVATRGTPRWWRIAGGVLWVLAGGLVLDFPGASLVALASILGIVLILEGASLIAVGLTTRRSGGALTPVAADSPHELTTVPPVPPAAL